MSHTMHLKEGEAEGLYTSNVNQQAINDQQTIPLK